MNDTPDHLAQDRYQSRLHVVVAAGASFLAGMLVNNWLERRIRRARPTPPPSVPTPEPRP